MASVVTVHSFQQGTGRSAIISRLAVILALSGHRVGLFEADLLHPGLCQSFGLPDESQRRTANQYLRGECTISDAAVDLGPRLHLNKNGALFIIPASTDAPDGLQTLHQHFEPTRLGEGLGAFARDFNLDLLLIDAPAGEQSAALVTTAISDTLLVVLRLDEQDYLGSGVVVDVARHMQAPGIILVANRVDSQYDSSIVRARLAETYHCEVAAVIPESRWMASNSAPVSALFPSHDPAAIAIVGLARRIAPQRS